MDNKFVRIAVWWGIWVVLTVVFIDFLPQHPHIKYIVLLSPFILLTSLLEPVGLLSDFPSEFIPGVIFFAITLLLYFFPRKKGNESKKSDSINIK